MIKKKIIKENKIPIAVVIDYNEYKRLKEIKQDKLDYESALKVKKSNKKWLSQSDLKKKLKLS